MQTLSEKIKGTTASGDGTNCSLNVGRTGFKVEMPSSLKMEPKGMQTGNAKTDINTKQKESGIIRFLFVTITDF